MFLYEHPDQRAMPAANIANHLTVVCDIFLSASSLLYSLNCIKYDNK